MSETAQLLPVAPFLRNRLTAGTDGASHRILVVDDNRTITLLLKQMLEAEGHEVLIARDGRQALDLVAKGPPDLIFLDLNLPEVDGYQVCSRLKHNPATRLIPIVIITGQSSFDTKLRAWELGADDFLTKPFHCVEVMARCRSLLRVKRLVDETRFGGSRRFRFCSRRRGEKLLHARSRRSGYELCSRSCRPSRFGE